LHLFSAHVLAVATCSSATSIDNCSQTQILIFVLLRGFST
jgi:hypothetical protein